MIVLHKASVWLSRILFFIIAFFAIYNVLFLVFPFEKETTYTNVDRVEEFVYSRKKYSVVFLGSGLIGGFNKELTKRQDSFNLYLPYSGSCTGIKILAMSNNIPDTAFVEINYIYKGFDDNLINKLFNTDLYKLKFFIPLLQNKYKPISIFKHIFNIGNETYFEKTKRKDFLFKQSLVRIKNEHCDIDSAKIMTSIDELKMYTSYLSSKGCVLVFFEMPVHEYLTNSPLYNFQRKLVKMSFHNKDVRWIKMDVSNKYYTVDGIHLLEESNTKFLLYFNRCLKNKLCVE